MSNHDVKKWKKNTENFRKYKTLDLKQNERTEEYAYEKKTKNLIFLSIDICRRLWPGMATGIQFPITIFEPCTERFRWTKRRIDFYKFDNLQINNLFSHKFFNENTKIRNYNVATFVILRFVSHMYSNCNCANKWTTMRTGKGNVFKCFLACHRGQRVAILIRSSTISISTIGTELVYSGNWKKWKNKSQSWSSWP